MLTLSSTTRAGTVAAATAAVLTASLSAGTAGQAEAATYGKKALGIAASKKGAPYRYGAEGPRSFDCSGLVQYAFKRAGKRLPRTAAQQYRAAKHIPKNHRVPGDLVFFSSSHGVYHVGIYAGHGRIWNAPHSGAHVRLDKIWSSRTLTGRVR